MKDHKITELTFQAIVEASPDAVILVNKEGKIAYVNLQTEKLFQYNRIELISKQIEILIPERFKKNHPTFLSGYFDSPQPREMGYGRELYGARKDQSEFPVEIGLSPLVTLDGIMVVASIIDISERKKAEEKFKLVVEASPSAMILVNKKGMITLINTQTEKLFGYKRNELIGKQIEILIPKNIRENHIKLRESFFLSPTTRSMGAGRELLGIKKNRSEFPVEIGLNPIETEEEIVVLVSIVDITEKKKSELIIQNQLVELGIKNKELEHFNYIASHDLQEPIRTITNYVNLLEDEFNDHLNEDSKNFLQVIKRGTKRMSSLVHALLDYSRLGRTKKLVNTNCNLILKEVLEDLKLLILDSKAEITIENLPLLPTYEIEFRQLFQNLIHNAIKFKKRNLPPKISIGFTEKKEGIEFYVSDNGIGIQKKHFDRIYHIFQRLNKETDYDGHGIGLSFCKKIVELHGGRIWVESEFGKGSTFKFIIKK